ncbi:hypothetical protein AZI86_08980 [Bdellovibrio bacteriovorus]|uniref:Uncharacterized protein n=1 Tax=Bdellovibrio bacteriovorus TaxID=959 RepID=A0A150WS30_BDEBC|nr:hypothetical protein [Bdellovibrio bacteriovorus]KYG67134.1 hypothetical protein AZI86_08980 [Bdellovibrio bacteriovorus]
MKAFIVAALIFAGTSAFADTQVLSCKVPNSTSVSLNIALGDDQSVDFVTVVLVEKAKQVLFFSQMDKGTVQDQIDAGYLNLLALTDKSAQVDGVIVNTGFLGLSKDTDGSFGGFLAAQGNIYPLTCTK